MRYLEALAIIAVAALLVTAVPSAPVDADVEGTSVAYDGTTYHYTRHLVIQDYYSVMTGFEAGTDTYMRLQSRLEGYEVTEIADRVLAGSSKVTTFVIPEGIKSMGSEMFKGCSKLDTIVFLGPMPEFKDDTFKNIRSGVQIKYLEMYLDSWASFDTLPKSVLPVYEYKSSDCSFTYYEMDGSVTIHKQKSGTKITIPSELPVNGNNVPVKHIGASAFLYDETSTQYKITSVTISEGIEVIDIAAFKYCEFMETLSLPSSIVIIYDEAFRMPIDNINWNRSALKSLALPDGLEYLGFEAFRMCYNLKTVTVPDSVTYYGDGAFRVCSSMETITLGKNIKSLGESSFDNCHSLKTVNLPDGLESIGAQCFTLDYSLEKIVIPDSVRTIGATAFSGCTALTEVSSSDNVSIGNNCFQNTAIITYKITSSSNSSNGIIGTTIKNGGWTLPGANHPISLLVIDTGDSVNLSITGTKDTFVRLTDKSVKTTGGTFVVDGKTVTGAERAGNDYGFSNNWEKASIATLECVTNDSRLGTATLGGTYVAGTEITIKATPTKYVNFNGWSDGNKDLERKVKLDGDIRLMADFSKATTYRLTIKIDPANSGIYSGAGLYKEGDKATATATPSAGYNFIGWSDGVTEASREITMDKDLELTASFGNLTITFDVNGGKTPVQPMYSNDGWKITLPGSDEIMDGKKIVAWTIDGTNYDVGSEYTVHASVTAKAVWDSAGPTNTDYTWIIVAVIVIVLIAIVALFLFKRNSNKTR